MRAVRMHEPGDPEVLRLEDVDDPTPAAGQVVVRVAAAGVNFIDTYQRSGAYELPLPTTLGLEGAGEVVAVADDVTGVEVGEIVGFSDQLGAYAEQVAIAADRAVRVPAGVAPDLAAAALLQGMTAHFLSHSTYPLRADDTALVWAPAGGVGRLLVQLATRRGARVIACTSTADKAAEARRLGADAVIDYREQDVPAAVRELTDGRGVQVVYDSVGAASFDDSLAALASRGTLVVYGQSSGPIPPLDVQTLNQHGSLFLTRPSLFHHVADADELAWRAGAVLDLVAGGDLEVHVHDRYPLGDAARAHTDLASGTTAGKLLLVPDLDAS